MVRKSVVLWLVYGSVAWANPVPGLASGDEAQVDPSKSPLLAGPVGGEILSRESEYLAILQERDPEGYADLMRVKSRDYDRYLQHLFRAVRTIDRFRRNPELIERHLEMRELERELRDLARGFGDLEAKEQKELRERMVNMATQLFELKQMERRERLADLSVRIEELQTEIDQREADRNAVIKAYVDQMVDERVEL